MREAEIDFGGLVEELSEILAEEICQIELTLVRLDELRGAVIKRDESGLRALLESIQNEGSSYRLVELRREVVRRRAAEVLGCGADEVNISRICQHVGERERELLTDRQEKLAGLVNRLRVEHSCTRILLNECSRFNKMLLRGIFGQGREAVVYDRRGGACCDIQGGRMNIEL